MEQPTIVLITGANTGLGFEMVKAFCDGEKAYEIILGGRSLAKAREAADAVTKEFSSSRSKVSAIQVDIEDDESIQRSFDEVQTKFGRLDALINNAGMKICKHFEVYVC